MKTLKIIGTGLALCLTSLASAQDKTPTGATMASASVTPPDEKFSRTVSIPARMEVSEHVLGELFQATGEVNIALSPSFPLRGTVENRQVDEAGYGTVLLRTESLDGAMLSLARSRDDQGNVRYTGHLLKLHAPEALLLTGRDHNYYFVRTQQRYLLAE